MRANQKSDFSIRAILQICRFGTAAWALLAGAAGVQAPNPKPEFDVASVKVNRSGRQGSDGFQVSHGSMTVRNVSLKMLVEAAYGIQGSRVVGGPNWSTSERYDVTAKGSANATKQDVWKMLQALFAERFKLKLHTESRKLSVYELELGKSGLKLRNQSDAGCAEDTFDQAKAKGLFVVPCGKLIRSWGPKGGQIAGTRVAISDLADALSAFLSRPVTDKTGMKGTYNIQLAWTPDGYQTPASGESEGHPVEPSDPGPSIFAAIQEQLGLKLTSAKGPVDVLVIESAEKPPAD